MYKLHVFDDVVAKDVFKPGWLAEHQLHVLNQELLLDHSNKLLE